MKHRVFDDSHKTMEVALSVQKSSVKEAATELGLASERLSKWHDARYKWRHDLFFFGPSKQAMHIGGYQPDKSYVLDVKTYPLNTEIKTIKTYIRAPLGMASFNGGTPVAVGPTGNFTVELNTSMVLLPKTPMPIRYGANK